MSAIVRKSADVAADVVAAGTGTTRQILIGPDEAPHFALRKFVMQPGGGMPPHTNTVEHEQFILEGSATIGIGDETFPVQAGDVVFIPGGAPHWYKADGDQPFAFLCMVPNLPDEIELVGE